MTVGVLGGGLTGLVLASRLQDVEVLEKADHLGGLCTSLKAEGFTFDQHGSHILFSRNAQAMDFYKGLLRDNVVTRRRNTKVFYKGRFVKYPFENGLSDLPLEENYECLVTFLEAHFARLAGKTAKPTNFKEWMYGKFGKGITEKYLLPYNEKIWKTPAEQMGIDWVEGRVPDPPLEDVVKASLGIATEGYTHQLHFLYPRAGGVQALTDALVPHVRRATTNFTVSSLRKRGGKWVVSDRKEERIYERLVSTIPIPDLVRALEDVPAEVRAAADALVHRSLYTVMLGVDLEGLNDLHWLYFPRPEEGLFNRASFPANYSDQVCPPGTSSVLVETTCTFGDEVWSMTAEAMVEHVTAKLDEAGLLKRREVTFTATCRTRHAYVVFDLHHRRNLDLVNAYTAAQGIESVGRFGQFDYINTDQCILRALALAEKLTA